MRNTALVALLALATASSALASGNTIRISPLAGGGTTAALFHGLTRARQQVDLPRPAPPLKVEWLDGRAPDLAGKVLLVRLWTIDCAYCTATAPALEDLHRRYAGQGLVVIGVHHPKSKAGQDRATVAARAKQLGFTFPVAQDLRWETVNAWWPGPVRDYTSATLLVDRLGQIRFAHPGGEFHASKDRKHSRCARDRDEVERWVQRVLAEH